MHIPESGFNIEKEESGDWGHDRCHIGSYEVTKKENREPL